jgi:2-keto-4-pentenoate hydratase/2-oxohepta-3-ene-1,7-dioic acid hydratase in catechol pathway
MKLARFDIGMGPRTALVMGEQLMELTSLGDAYSTVTRIVAGGSNAIEGLQRAERAGAPTHRLSEVRLLAPIERPGKYLAIGMNYRKHLEEAEKLGVPAPKQQLWFNKQTSCISGPFDDIDPGVTARLDYEVELGVVIGTPAKAISSSTASEHIFGYFVANDVSARDWQFHSPTFTVGKSFDTHGPIGPWIVTADEIKDPHALGMRCFVNGQLRQSSTTNQMIHNIYEQIAYLSTAFTLESGDLLATGTPEGVGVGMSPPRFLTAGDVVRCEIDQIGAIENHVVAQGA